METRRLKRILEVKRRIEQAKKGDVATARNELDEAYAGLLHAQHEQRTRLSALEGENEVTANELAERARFVVLAGKMVGAARELVTQRDSEVASREEARVQATRDVKTFEVLHDRGREEQRVIARNAEQRAADEVAASRRSSS